MEKLTIYLKESYQELVKNVSWPTVAQLQESTIVVLVTSGILAPLVQSFLIVMNKEKDTAPATAGAEEK